MSEEKVRDVKVKADVSVKELMSLYRDIHGFTASDLARAADILVEGVKEADLRFISFTGNLIATGVRGIISQLIDEGIFNVVITTCGALDHDIAKSLGGSYLKGSFDVDDVDLEKRGIHRLGNVFIPFESYGLKVEAFVKELIPKALKIKEEWGVRELLNLAGELLKEDLNSILGAAYRRNVPIYVPGITDGAFGTNLFIYTQQTPFKLNILKDVKELMDLVFNARKSLALVLGGGISKHHTIWWNQFKEGLDYAVYVTTAVEWDGSLSGARTREAVSWGKIKPQAKHVTVYGDVTVLLPIIASYILSFK
ncbi:MAG: deoxyhypusine synthase [Zestosphaera tikiterensis]|uniref:Probable deoxyhypusine synthase n=1 Tax=Zestosphaera tikiterensis TaxID=1973259 RepID=A0A2R7Y6F5_9CREN|nr:MAG: deoxyhypusine synthase [Zestosphaera tikiterensis]